MFSKNKERLIRNTLIEILEYCENDNLSFDEASDKVINQVNNTLEYAGKQIAKA